MNRRLRAVAFMILAMALFAAMDAINKTLVQRYPIAQIMTVRFALFVAIACAVARRGPWLVFETRAPGWQLLRSAVLLAEMAAFVLAFRYLPLADVHAVAAAGPLVATALAAFFLRERVDALGWGLVVGGLFGALLVAGPGFETFGPPIAIAVAAALLWGGYQVVTRRVAAWDPPDVTTLHTPLVGLVVLGAVAALEWRSPDALGWALLLVGGAMGSAAHLLLVRALALAPASALQPYNYFLLVFAALAGFCVYGDVPGPWTWAGAAIVVACGLAAMRRQARIAD